ncbi:hypothetical protein C0991_012276 [Blastosporella zonata]|nr:hypothetical protein C0991_012276 [Blastosporella zonata]
MLGRYPAPDEQGSPIQNRPGKRARNAHEDQGQPLYHHQQMTMSREPLGFTEEHSQDGKRKEARPQEKDKNRRLSCKECRRLKLKCDRVFPCQSCVKRGCGSLCPEGALTSGRGSRFILANTEQLHEKITVLSDRVRDLEDALQTLQATHSVHPHPLLAPDLLRIKTSQDLYIAPQAQTQHIQQQDHTPDHLADSALSLSLSSTQPPYAPSTGSSLHASGGGSNSNGGEVPSLSYPPDVPPDILQLSSTFPFPWSVDLRIRKRIREALPPRHEALAICEAARNNALWQYHLDASETFLQNLLHHCYASPIEDLSPRRLALLLMILSIGSLVDLSRPLGSLYGEAYHHLARAAVCEIPLMEEPDFDVLHALFFMVWWHLIFSDNKKAIGYAWNLMGFVAKLAQGLGLHRDNPRLRGIPEEDEKRRAVFWELLNLDARMSLSLGRPPSICLRHVDTKPPAFKGPGLYVPREEMIYHEWKNTFFIQCLTPILEATAVVDPPAYSTIVELDSLVRNFDTPKLLEAQPNHGQGGQEGSMTAQPRFLTMQRALVATSREIALLQLHRRFFTEAMSRPEAFDLATHAYAPSVLATCLGAATLIESIETLFDNEPQLSARFLYFWFNSYSATATLALFVARSPSTPFAPEAQKHVDRACRLFARASQLLPLCRRLQHVTEKLAEKSRQALKQYQSSAPAPSAPGPSTNRERASSSSSPSVVVPESFRTAHPILLRCLERQRQPDLQQPRSPEIPRTHAYSPQSQSQGQGQQDEAWLPDIYSYAYAGVSKELRYPFPFGGQGQVEAPRIQQQSQAQQAFVLAQAPFVLGTPRVDANEEFNFDHGALKQCEETGYMAWF